VNLLRNGGLDFVKVGSPVIPFWEVDGAAINATPPNNSFGVVVRETQESEIAAARYLKFSLSSDEPVILTQEFSDRFIQMGFTNEVGQAYDDSQHLEDVAQEFDERQLYYETHDCLLVRGSALTISLSMRVPQGRASLKIAAVPGVGDDIETEIKSRVSSEDWIRATHAVDYDYKRIRKLKIILSREPGAGSTEVHLGAFMMALGSSSSLPYTGDPMADAFPDNMIVFAFGDVCPPGFERMAFVSPPETGRIFPKGGSYVGDDVIGSETHDHGDARVTMNPARKWSTTELVPGSETSEGSKGDDGTVSHSHPKEEALHVPPTKDSILCKRISWSQGA